MVQLVPKSASANMEEDYQRLLALKEGDPPQVHIYAWRAPSLTYGYFMRPEQWLDLAALKQAGYETARRPTGGGILFHTHDLSFSVLIPKGHTSLSDNTLENYRLINDKVKEAISPFIPEKSELLVSETPNSSFCMAQPTIYDVMVNGKKVGGAAQRRTRTGLLHQGTICLQTPDPEHLSRFLLNPNILTQMQANSFSLQTPHDILAERLLLVFKGLCCNYS